MYHEELDYYRAREGSARVAAAAATHADIRRIHLQLADLYARRISAIASEGEAQTTRVAATRPTGLRDAALR